MINQNKTTRTIISSIMTVMLVVIFVVIAALVVGSILSSSVVFDNIIDSGSVSNETLTSVSNLTNSTLDIRTTITNAICSLTLVRNTTGGEIVIALENYTFFTDCNLIMIGGSPYIGGDLNTSYSYTFDTNRNVAGINVSNLSNQFGLFVTGLVAFLAIIGTIVGVVWLVVYVKALFDKKDGLQAVSA